MPGTEKTLKVIHWVNEWRKTSEQVGCSNKPSRLFLGTLWKSGTTAPERGGECRVMEWGGDKRLRADEAEDAWNEAGPDGQCASKNTGLHSHCLGGLELFVLLLLIQNVSSEHVLSYLPVSGFAYCIFRIEIFKSNCHNTILWTCRTEHF